MSLSSADLVVCANTTTEKLLTPYYRGKLKKMLDVGVADLKSEYGLPIPKFSKEGVRFVWLGGLSPRKAPQLAISAFAKACEMGDIDDSVMLDMVGDGPLMSECRALVNSHKIKDRVIFHGMLPHADAQNILRAGDAFIFSSVRDTAGTVVLEAMSEAKPVICINHQGAADMTTTATAFKVEPGSVEETVDAFAEAIVELTENKKLRKKMGDAGQDRVREKYLWCDRAETMVSWYREILN